MIEVRASDGDLDGAAMEVTWPNSTGLAAASTLSLAPLDAADLAVPAQILPGTPARLAWRLERPLKKGESRRYAIRLLPNPAEATMKCAESESAIELREAGRLILRYWKKPSPEAAENEPHYSRTGYIHPFLTPKGQSVTGDYPTDHPHQHGLFFAWTNTEFAGHKLNFWDQKAETGRVLHDSTVETLEGNVVAGFTVRLRHEDLVLADKPTTVLDETWTVRAWRAVEGEGTLVDIESRQVCASDRPLQILKYHYGGMAIRGPAAWFNPVKDAEPPAAFFTSEGKSRTDGNHTRPDWVAMTGPADEGGSATVAIFSHPENFRAPQWVRLHPAKPYFVFTPMVEEGFAIEPDRESPYVSRYRYLVFDGKPDPATLNRVWLGYSKPPAVSLVFEQP